MKREQREFAIPGRLDGLNDYVRACRRNRMEANKMKKMNEGIVAAAARCVAPVNSYPAKLEIVWYEKDRRRDCDNVFFAVKFILDALVKSGILVNDSQAYVSAISHELRIDKGDPRIHVRIIEPGEEDQHG